MRSRNKTTARPCYPIIGNCNFASRDDGRGRAIHEARQAVESRLTDDATLVAALDSLEETLGDHADGVYESAVRLCRAAEQAVENAWTDDVQAEVETNRVARYRD